MINLRQIYDEFDAHIYVESVPMVGIKSGLGSTFNRCREMRFPLIFIDRDSVANALAGMHDTHTLAFDSKADSITARIRTWSTNLYARLHEDYETKRTQERITEINCFIDFLHSELDNL
ncbi:unnamed protein product [Dibothriocephalus latus]|uniref:Uncharacterized protein n=1 Tax=Dibothriocephalus latus TaxID=60516 RepID=A0A3P6UC86_DIBLA|nr:unnamed protein product [Dibothriocephalus latus]